MKFACIVFLTLLISPSAIAQPKPKKAKSNKEIVAAYQSGLSIVREINPVKYKVKSRKIEKVTIEVDSAGQENYQVKEETVVDDKTYVGITAESLQAVAPDLVTSYINEYGEEDLTVDYVGLTYLLINAVKEQQVLIEEIQNATKTNKK